MFLKLLLVATIATIPVLSFDSVQSRDTPVKVEIFYETMNSKVRNFFLEQFQLAFDNLGENMEVYLYPYGNTTYENKEYNCAYGEKQCEANKLHACLINENSGDVVDVVTNETISIVQCFIHNRNSQVGVLELGQSCVPDWDPVKNCIDTDDSLIGQLKVITKGVSALDGLAVRIDGTASEEYETNFVGSICEKFPDVEFCKNITGIGEKVPVSVFYLLDDRDMGDYIHYQLHSYFHVLEKLIQLEPIPLGNVAECRNSTSPQCFNLKFQAMVIERYLSEGVDGHLVSGPNRVLDFLDCLTQSHQSNVFSKLEVCSNNNLEIDVYRDLFEKIRQNHEELTSALDNLSSKHGSLGSSSESFVQLNNETSLNAYNNLVGEVCLATKTPKPSICTKTKMRIFYETMNHQSRTFFLQQLKPTFYNLRNVLDLELIPAGRTKFIAGEGEAAHGGHFECPGGELQCESIKLEACLVDQIWDNGANYTDLIHREVMDTILCSFKNKMMLEAPGAVEYCTEKHLDVDSYMTIVGCVKEGTVNGVLTNFIQETHSVLGPQLENLTLPVVQINGEILENVTADQIQSEICQNYKPFETPDYCVLNFETKIDVNIYYQSDNLLAGNFFTTQLDPWYMYVEEMINLHLFPAGDSEDHSENGTCAHYEQDSLCAGNSIQAYVIDEYQEHDEQDSVDGTFRVMKFLSCFFSFPNWSTAVWNATEKCASEALEVDEFYDLMMSVKSEIGVQIYKEVLNRTEELKQSLNMSSFAMQPWVTLDQQHSHKAANDLLKTVCNEYKGIKVDECVPVSVDVYYKALDPEVRKFFLDQLVPTFRELRERIELRLIPFGATNVSELCPEGAADNTTLCTASRAHACAVRNVFEADLPAEENIFWDEKNQTIEYVNCMFKNVENEMDMLVLSEHCVRHHFVLDQIDECVKQNESIDYLQEMQTRTSELLESGQTSLQVLLNSDQVYAGSSFDLQKEICSRMLGDKPSICDDGKASKVKLQFHYSALDQESANFVLNELYETYRNLEEIIDIDIVPFGLMGVESNDDGSYSFHCPNGPEECKANRIHACVYNEFSQNTSANSQYPGFDNQLMLIEFLKCYFDEANYPSDVTKAAADCVESLFGDYWSHGSLLNCSRGAQSAEILKDFERNKVSTLLPHLAYVPWLTVDGRHNYGAESHLTRTVCDQYPRERKPTYCYVQQAPEPKQSVTIHYEPKDPKSKQFFTGQFLKSLAQVGGLVNLKLIPFGRSTESNGTDFSCVNDPECHSYKEQACVIESYLQSEPQNTLQFVSCVFEKNGQNAENECFNEKFNGDWSAIDICAREGRGDQLLANYSQMVSGLNPKISHVPWILINDQHSLDAETNLANEVCNTYYSRDKPDQCKPKMANVVVYYETQVDSVASLFQDQLQLFMEYLDEIATFHFNPYGTTTRSGNDFTCKKGAGQCLANKIHACLLDEYYLKDTLNRIRTVSFLECYFTSPDSPISPVQIAQQCFEQNFAGPNVEQQWNSINDCATGDKGRILLDQFGKQTESLDPALKSVPLVTIQSSQVSKRGMEALFQSVCDAYELVKPALCMAVPNSAVKVGVYFSFNEQGKKFLLQQLMPFYKPEVPIVSPEARAEVDEAANQALLQAMIETELIPWGDTVYNESNTNPFECESEEVCHANRLLACASHYHRAEPRGRLHLVLFALCIANSNQSVVNATNDCANLIWSPDPFEELNTCARGNGQEQIEIFLQMKSKTELLQVKSFPAVTIDQKVDADALENLIKMTCVNYKGSKLPSECTPYIDNSEEEGEGGALANGPIPFTIMLLALLAFFTQY